MYTHIFLEAYCSFDWEAGAEQRDLPPCCSSPEKGPSYQCLFQGCPYATFTSCENTLCYIGANSEAEALISFGGEMGESDSEIRKWKEICSVKISEAFDEYMKKAKGELSLGGSEKAW